ncbi:MAG: NGG1p interacting factor NIF3 [Thermodesulfovibrionales bacterium]|nr:NGG1p interacting factor NIF3 [Thermodesulfovibrionales bacterium]
MKLYDFYKKAISIGIDNDPRGKDAVLSELSLKKKNYENMSPREKEYFDLEHLENPYPDTRILYGDNDTDLKNILVGIDIDSSEVLLADYLKNKNIMIDAIISHHPSGKAFANLHAVMYMQADILYKFGVPINIAEGLMESRIKEIERRIAPINHSKAVDVARLLRIPFICLHTPSDNMVANYLQKTFQDQKPITLDDIIDILLSIEEYKQSSKNGSCPKILIGNKNRKAGKIFVDMTGGTEGSKEIFNSLSLSGVNTIVAMHLSEEHRTEAEKNHLNVIIAGHIASDNLGLNLLLDELTIDEQIIVYECSGFRRVKRK